MSHHALQFQTAAHAVWLRWEVGGGREERGPDESVGRGSSMRRNVKNEGGEKMGVKERWRSIDREGPV